MTESPSSFVLLARMSNDMPSEERRNLLREVTAKFGQSAGLGDDAVLAPLDEILSALSTDFTLHVRAELAQLVAATSRFERTASKFAIDDIEVAGPILKHSRALSEATLLKVVAQKSQSHLMAVTKRQEISPVVSHALVEAGNDNVVVSLLSNEGAQIAQNTFETVASRAQGSNVLQAPLIRRQDVPVELLNDLYVKVESGLRLEIVSKFNSLSSEEIEKAFQRSRTRLSKPANASPEDFDKAQCRIDDLDRRGFLNPPGLATLMREGAKGRTAFNIAFARLANVEFDLVQRTVEARDLDTVGLLCRGAGFDRALYVSIAIALKNPDEREPTPEKLGKLYESVPVQAAQRALRFWKARIAA